jgi:hypothetical protein
VYTVPLPGTEGIDNMLVPAGRFGSDITIRMSSTLYRTVSPRDAAGRRAICVKEGTKKVKD